MSHLVAIGPTRGGWGWGGEDGGGRGGAGGRAGAVPWPAVDMHRLLVVGLAEALASGASWPEAPLGRLTKPYKLGF